MTQIIKKNVTIAVGETLSPEVNLEGDQLVGLLIPANFDGTTLGIKTALKDDAGTSSTYVDVQESGASSTALAITTVASRYVPLDNLALTAGLKYIKLSAGTAQATTDTVITLILRQVA